MVRPEPKKRAVDGPASARVRINAREYVNFVGSGYLALTRRPEIRSAARRALQGGAAFSRQFATGIGLTERLFDQAEERGAAAFGTEASVYFASGYLIGLVGTWSLSGSYDTILIDESAHHCLRDGAKLAGVPVLPYAHCDVDSLRDVLKRNVKRAQRPLVLTDGAFATTGRVPPLAAYAEVLQSYAGKMFIDESHTFGVIGRNGRGSAEYCEVEQVATRGATLSKAFCAQGAMIGCSHSVAAELRFAPPIRGACAGSPISAAVAAASMAYVSRRPHLRAKLAALTRYFRVRLWDLGLDVIDSPAPIVSFKVGRSVDMERLQQSMLRRGIYIYHSKYIGAGPEGMIRCAVFADHTRDDIDLLIGALRKWS